MGFFDDCQIIRVPSPEPPRAHVSRGEPRTGLAHTSQNRARPSSRRLFSEAHRAGAATGVAISRLEAAGVTIVSMSTAKVLVHDTIFDRVDRAGVDAL